MSSDSNYKTIIGSIHDLYMLGQRSWKYSLDLRQIFYLIIFDDFESEETQYTFTFHPSDLANKKFFLFFFLKENVACMNIHSKRLWWSLSLSLLL